MAMLRQPSPRGVLRRLAEARTAPDNAAERTLMTGETIECQLLSTGERCFMRSGLRQSTRCCEHRLPTQAELWS
jgi:hypothetical protein